MLSMRRRLGRLAGITVTAMLVVHMTGCEVDTDQGGPTFQLPEGGRFDLPGSDGSSLDVNTGADAPRPDGTDDASSGLTQDGSPDAGGLDAALDVVTNDSSSDAQPAPDAGLLDAALDAVVFDAVVLDAVVADAIVVN